MTIHVPSKATHNNIIWECIYAFVHYFMANLASV